ncbi:MAG: hypothetical protein ACYC1Q_07155 [Bacteroidia bacterium]
METNTEKIDRYLLNEMGPEEKAGFEKDLANDPALKKEFIIQKDLTQQLQRMGLKGEIAQKIRHIRLMNTLLWISIIVAVALILGVSVFLWMDKKEAVDITHFKAVEVSLPITKVQISTETDTILETPGGMMLAIPAGAFDTESKSIEIQIQEALTDLDIVKSGLSTTSSGELLQSAGMFSVRAFDGDKELYWKKDVNVLIPTEEVNPNMMLFDGEVLDDGTINWVNPVKINEDLPSIPMAQLDFYPEQFIPTLKDMGENIRDKRYTDSIYYSFSGYQEPDRVVPPREVPFDRPEPQMQDVPVSKNGTDPLFQFASTFVQAVESDTIAALDAGDRIFFEIDPSRIKAFWNEEFDNTLLATKAFEERMRYIHSTCEPKYLLAYLNHLDWQMWEIDSLCMQLAKGSQKEKFREFYQRKEGGVRISSALQQKLLAQYENKQKAWKEATEKTWQAHYRELDSLQNVAMEKRLAFSVKDALREVQVFKDELCRNLKDAYRQVGGVAYCNEPLPEYYAVDVSTPGWKNLDQYVFAATLNRESMTYTDPVFGKTATLTYSPVEFIVNQEDSFDRVMLYLLPDSLSSFQRVLKKEGAWKEKLNANLNYRFVVIAYKGEDFYWQKISKLEAQTYSLNLEKGEEADLQKFMKRKAKGKVQDIHTELDFYRFEIKEQLRLDKVKQQAEWRRRIAAVVFPCGTEPGTIGMEDSETQMQMESTPIFGR